MEKSDKELILDAWKERGTVEFNDTFQNISDTELANLKRKINKMDGVLDAKHTGENLSIADEHYTMGKKAASPTAKKLLLSSGQNAVAESIQRYLRLHYKSRIMSVRNYHPFF